MVGENEAKSLADIAAAAHDHLAVVFPTKTQRLTPVKVNRRQPPV